MIDLESAQLFFLGRVLVHSPASPSLYFYRTGAYVEKLQNLGMPPVITLKGAAQHCCIRHDKEI